MENLRRKKLFGGVKTAHEVHAELAWPGAKCWYCKGPPAIRLRSIGPVKDLVKANPQLMTLLAAKYGGQLPTMPTIHGDCVCISEVFACSNCKGEAERAASKHPDWMHVEIDRGPGPDAPVVAVPEQWKPEPRTLGDAVQLARGEEKIDG